jgi:hypothetical protein
MLLKQKLQLIDEVIALPFDFVLPGEQLAAQFAALAFLFSSTTFSHEFLRLTHLATGYLRHTAAPFKTWREGP